MKINEMMKLKLEQYVYALADRFIEGYTGGTWNYDAANCVWYPAREQDHKIGNCDNYYEGTMNSRAVGVALSCMAANRMLWREYERGNMVAAKQWDAVYKTITRTINTLDEDMQAQVFRFLD